MKSIISLASLVALSSAAAILPPPPPGQLSGPFGLTIESPSWQYNGKFFTAELQATSYAAATISPYEDNGFYYELRTGILYHQDQVAGGSWSGGQTEALAATPLQQSVPGQQVTPLTFQEAYNARGGIQADVSMGFDAQGYLTHAGQRNVWFACTGPGGQGGYAAISLLVGSPPDSSFCTPIGIRVAGLAQGPGGPGPHKAKVGVTVKNGTTQKL
ncbi:hypothetical protein TWF694_002937 [Orbilia ellipsospora]|uniref:Uncharacterized protein n=1 Tax=Orbilia ellipsospora TaxID=2528407 RepID=A0AAV9X0G7_9PEZI